MPVHLKRDYSLSVRRQLDRYPVWEIGSPVSLGDYGVLRDKTFHKLGNIHGLGETFSTAHGAEMPYQFSTVGTSLVAATATGVVSPGGISAPIRAAVELRFTEEHGMFIRSERSRISQIAELNQLAMKLRRNDRWRFGWKLVTELREVNPATIIMGSSAGSALKIEGASDILEQFKIGALKAGAAIAFTGEAALQVVGLVGPVFLDLCYLPRFFGDVSRAGATQVDEVPETPYVRLKADPAIPDDPDDQ